MIKFECSRISDCIEPTNQRIEEFEKYFGARLLPDYRRFLANFGGSYVSAIAPIKEPTPCGDVVAIRTFVGFTKEKVGTNDIYWWSDLVEGAPVLLPIADCWGGRIDLLLKDSSTGAKAGSVYFFDEENRGAWPDEMFYNRFGNMHQSIENYLVLRRSNQLPNKDKRLMDYYLIAENFREFIESVNDYDVNSEA